MAPTPSYELSPDAEEDWLSIIDYTYQQFGANQVVQYTEQLSKCIASLVAHEVPSKSINLDGLNIRSIHCQRHYIIAIDRIHRPMLIVAILHERMDLMRRLKNRL